jgi:CRP-like cAMP-binding protein
MFVPELNKTLTSEVMLFRRGYLIRKVPFLLNCNPEMVHQLVLALLTKVALPGDYVITQDSVGSAMYMITRGSVEVTVATDTEEGDDDENNFMVRDRIVTTLSQGHFFGEIALVYSVRRTASVRAKTFSEFCM